MRSTGVVVSACQSAGRSAARRRTCSTSSPLRGDRAERCRRCIPARPVPPPPAPLPSGAPAREHQPVVRIDSVILPLGQASLVACPLEAELPLSVGRPALLLDAVQGGDGGFQPGGADGLQESLGDGSVDLAGEEGLADQHPRTRPGPCGTRSGGADHRGRSSRHPAPAAAADDPARAGGRRRCGQHRGSCARSWRGCPAAAAGSPDRPQSSGRRDRHPGRRCPMPPARPPLDRRRRLTRLHLAFDPAVDEHAGIGRVGQHLLDHLIGWPHPDGLAGLRAVLDQSRQGQTVPCRCTARALRSTAKRSNTVATARRTASSGSRTATPSGRRR